VLSQRACNVSCGNLIESPFQVGHKNRPVGCEKVADKDDAWRHKGRGHKGVAAVTVFFRNAHRCTLITNHLSIVVASREAHTPIPHTSHCIEFCHV
jgi:hypothetical protein